MLKLEEVLAEYRPTDTLYEISLFEFFSPVKIAGFYGSLHSVDTFLHW